MVLVTGATDHVGKELVPQLLLAGQQVRVFTRDARTVALLGDRAKCVTGDFDRPDTLAHAVCGGNRVCLVTFEKRQDAAVLEAARRTGAFTH